MAKHTYYQKSDKPEHVSIAKSYFAKMQAHRDMCFAFAKRFGVERVVFSQMDNRMLGFNLDGVSPTYGLKAWTVHPRTRIAVPRRAGANHSKELLAEWKGFYPKETEDLTRETLVGELGFKGYDPFAHRFGMNLRTVDDHKVVLVTANFIIPGFTEITTSEYIKLDTPKVEDGKH